MGFRCKAQLSHNRHSGAPRSGEPGISRFRVRCYASPRNDEAKNYALNQPCASPVKEKYKPAAVSAQDTTSMVLSICSPPSPTIWNSEITESASEASSTQRGQFFRRWAASQTK